MFETTTFKTELPALELPCADIAVKNTFLASLPLHFRSRE